MKELAELWLAEAKANNVLPLNDMQVVGADLQKFLEMEFKVPVPPGGQYTYYPGTTEIPERSAANVARRVLPRARRRRVSPRTPRA